uniref:hypothetical protein n=1 Tax=Kocuria sp. ZOR0020 TaxID=1339234 RepID=UPI000645F345
MSSTPPPSAPEPSGRQEPPTENLSTQAHASSLEGAATAALPMQDPQRSGVTGRSKALAAVLLGLVAALVLAGAVYLVVLATSGESDDAAGTGEQ